MLSPAEQQKSVSDNGSACLSARGEEKRWTCLYPLHYPDGCGELKHELQGWFSGLI
jgi:hypothetical protein